jgi:C-terminal processing protease CtpA/Prc
LTRATLFPLLLATACAAPLPGSIGAVLAQSKDGRLLVRDAPDGLPAANAGIQPGSEILLIDGRDVRRMSAEQIHVALEGDVGSTVRLTLLSQGRIERLPLARAPLKARSSR